MKKLLLILSLFLTALSLTASSSETMLPYTCESWQISTSHPGMDERKCHLFGYGCPFNGCTVYEFREHQEPE